MICVDGERERKGRGWREREEARRRRGARGGGGAGGGELAEGMQEEEAPKVEEEADVWAPHISECWERSNGGYFGPYKNTVVCKWVQGHQRRIKWHDSKKQKIVMAGFKIGEL